MMNIFKTQPTVEQIHADFDSAQERLLKESDKIIAELGLIIETRLSKKAELCKELGFINSEPVNKLKSLRKEKEKALEQVLITQEQAQYLKELKNKYSNKFLTLKEFERICNKYNLTYAPVTNYVKDIPEKNLLEIKNSIPLSDDDIFETKYTLIGLRNLDLIKALGKDNPIFTISEMKDICEKYNGRCVNEWCKPTTNMWLYVAAEKLGFSYNEYNYNSTVSLDKSGLFVAAPKTHFKDLDKLSKKGKFGFFKMSVQEVKDPIVFEHCKNDMVRIITKWGTDDDQSYLDDALENEITNTKRLLK